MLRRALAVTFGVASAALGFAACNQLAGIDAPELGNTPASDAGNETASETASCDLASWPQQPTADDPDAGADQSFVVALRTISFGVDPSNPLGYDLDGTCTCPEPDSCKRPADAGTRCDERGGRDIALNQDLISVIQNAKGFSEADLNSGLERGRYGALIQVRKWNGTANDLQVEVAILLSPGWSGKTTDAGPGWDGGDPWDLDPISLSDPSTKTPRFVDDSAYVRDGVLVATRLDGARLTLGSGASVAEVIFTEAVITGKIVPRGATWGIEGGIIAGRWPTANALAGIANLQDPFLGGPLCKSALTYKTVKQKICGSADIPSNKARDRGALPCDALSLAIRFAADPAVFGGVSSLDAGADGAEASPCLGFTDECP